MITNNKIRKQIINHFKKGGSVKDAQKLFSIDYQQAYRWRERVNNNVKHRSLKEPNLKIKLKGVLCRLLTKF